MIKNSFREDIEYIFAKLKKKENFSFSKYADGEFAILVNQAITNADNWTFKPELHSEIRTELIRSFQYKDPEYYKGMEYGNDNSASHWKSNHSPLRNKISSTLIKQGYKKVIDRI